MTAAITTPPRPIARRQNALSDLLRRGMVFLFLVALMLFFAAQTDRFFTIDNLTNILVQNAPTIVVAAGVMLTMMMGGVDLSVGSVAALAGAVSAGLIARNGLPFGVAVAAGLAVGAAMGAVNGLLIVYGKLPPFVATLAMLGAARGLTLMYTEGKPISNIGDAYKFLGRGEVTLFTVGDTVIALPTPVIVALGVVIAVWWLLTHTRFGAHLYAIGGNEETARLAGVPVNRDKIITYAISGMLAGLFGMLLTGRVFSAQPRAGVGAELEAITAAVIGGVSLFGGIGNVWGMVIGALLVGVLGNGLKLVRVEPYTQQIIEGVVLVIAVSIDMIAKRLERGGKAH